jgi:2-amino-4-hydroxy-6-hydroxymethyldihydropteridine diphosphokinase
MKSDKPVYLSLGSNIQPKKNLAEAIRVLSREVSITQIASIWETPPFGGEGGNYLNTAIELKTRFSQTELKYEILRPIETSLGRIRTSNKYAPRTIDLDILIYKEKVIEPRIWDLPFLTLPLAELLPDLINPETGETLADIAHRLYAISDFYQRKELHFSSPNLKNEKL